ncbi:MAG: hypothetical protein HFI73_01490 [Bacilli bacterium]|nr:hypothetical protein [Bacilli bacterium]
MNNIDYLSENSFLQPYYRQFIKLLKNNKVLLFENVKTNASEYLQKNHLQIVNNKTEKKVNGIILNNYLSKFKEKKLLDFINELSKMLTEEGIILLINNKLDIDETTINFLFKEKFEELEELIGDEKWNFILYKKRTTK